MHLSKGSMSCYDTFLSENINQSGIFIKFKDVKGQIEIFINLASVSGELLIFNVTNKCKLYANERKQSGNSFRIRIY